MFVSLASIIDRRKAFFGALREFGEKKSHSDMDT